MTEKKTLGFLLEQDELDEWWVVFDHGPRLQANAVEIALWKRLQESDD